MIAQPRLDGQITALGTVPGVRDPHIGPAPLVGPAPLFAAAPVPATAPIVQDSSNIVADWTMMPDYFVGGDE